MSVGTVISNSYFNIGKVFAGALRKCMQHVTYCYYPLAYIVKGMTLQNIHLLNIQLFTGEGSSSNCCTDTYCGPSPFSEVGYLIHSKYSISRKTVLPMARTAETRVCRAIF